METTIRVITVPQTEWDTLNGMVRSLCEDMGQITGKKSNELLTVKEVCEILKIGATTFQRYELNGTLEIVRVSQKKGAKKYVKRSELERHIKSEAQE